MAIEQRMVDEETAVWRRAAGATRRRRSRERVMAAAQELFEVRGFAEVTVRNVAKQAGVGVVTVYNCFGGKDGLAAVVLGGYVEKLKRQAEEESERGTPMAEALVRHVYRVVELFATQGELGAAYIAALMRCRGPVESASDPRVLAPLPEPLAVLLRAGQQRGEVRPEIDAADVAAMVTNVLLLRLVARREEREVTVAAVADFALRGVLAG